MTDPRIAALAAALDTVDVQSGYRLSSITPPMGPTTLAAALLAALPPDWCGHADYTELYGWLAAGAKRIEEQEATIEDRIRLLAEANSEIARLRKIEEAAREAEERLDTLFNVGAAPHEDPERWAQAVYFALTALRAALEAER